MCVLKILKQSLSYLWAINRYYAMCLLVRVIIKRHGDSLLWARKPAFLRSRVDLEDVSPGRENRLFPAEKYINYKSKNGLITIKIASRKSKSFTPWTRMLFLLNKYATEEFTQDCTSLVCVSHFAWLTVLVTWPIGLDFLIRTWSDRWEYNCIFSNTNTVKTRI